MGVQSSNNGNRDICSRLFSGGGNQCGYGDPAAVRKIIEKVKRQRKGDNKTKKVRLSAAFSLKMKTGEKVLR